MPYFSDLNTYLHQSSLLIQAYPSARITTKYALPRKPNLKSRSQSKASKDTSASGPESTAEATDATTTQSQPKRERSATLTLKTYHPESGICLKYRTDKAAEVGRLLNGLGRLAKGETIEMPSTASATTAAPADGDADKMDIDGGSAGAVVKTEEKVATAPPAATQNAGTGGGGGGKGKKKKGKK